MLRQELRHRRLLALVLLAAAVAVAALALTRDRPATDAEGEALVIGRQVAMPSAALPGTAQAVFDDGAVAHAVSQRLGGGIALKYVVPSHVSLVAARDSITLRVVGHDPDPKKAADIANTAAAAFLTELNRAGVGSFVLLSPAVPAPAPQATPPPAWVTVPTDVLARLPVTITVVLALSVLLLLRPLRRYLPQTWDT